MTWNDKSPFTPNKYYQYTHFLGRILYTLDIPLWSSKSTVSSVHSIAKHICMGTTEGIKIYAPNAKTKKVMIVTCMFSDRKLSQS